MQPRRLSRTAGKLCRKHAWNARSKQRHVPDAKQVLLWKGWVLKQRLNYVQSRVGATATRAHVEPPLRTELFVDSCSVMTSGQLLREHTRNPRHSDLHPHTRHREMFMRQGCCFLTPRAHLDLSPCTRRPVHATTLLHSHAVNTLGSHSVREQEDMFMRQTAAFSRREHTWISLRAQRRMFHRKDFCVLTPQAHLDPPPCASKKTSSFDRLVRSHAKHIWISLRAQRDMSRRKDCCVLTPRAHLDLAPCAKKPVPSKNC